MFKKGVLLCSVFFCGLSVFAGGGTTISVNKFEPVMGAYEFIAHIREERGLNTALVSVPQITSDATTQPFVQARVVYTNGTAHTPWTRIGQLNSSGVLTGATIEVAETLYVPVRLEVRIEGTSVSAVMPQQTFHAGTSIVLDGQSDVYTSFRLGETDNIAPPALLQEGNVQYVHMNRNYNVALPYDPMGPPRRWTLTSQTERAWRTAGAVMVANMLHELKPGRHFLITIPAYSGQGIDDQVNTLGGNDRRYWSDEVEIARLAKLGGFHPGVYTYCFSSGTPDNDTRAAGAIFFGLYLDGSPYNPGDTFVKPAGASGANQVYEHTLAELYDRNKFKLNVTSMWSEDQRNNLKTYVTDNPVYQPYLTDPAWSVSYRGYLTGVDYGDSSHPDKNSYDGAARMAMMITHNALSAGHVVPPVIGHMSESQWRPGGDNKSVIMRPDNGPATTLRRIRGLPRVSGAAEVMGFLIDGVPAKSVTICDINRQPADTGYFLIKKNDGSNWTGNEVITRSPSFTGISPNPIPSNAATDAKLYDWAGVVSGPSETLPLGMYGDVPGWSDENSSAITPYGSSSVYEDAFSRVEAEDFDAQQGVNVVSSGSGQSIGWIANGDWTRYLLDFGSGAQEFSVRVSTPNSGGTIELRLGSTTGTLIGTASIPNTGDYVSFTNATCSVSGVSGEQTLYLVFTGTMDVDYFSFSQTQQIPVPDAAFSANITSGTAPLAVTFTDSSTGSITNRTWTFGDGQTANTAATTISHTYASAGTYTVQLTVTGAGGSDSQIRSGYITVSASSGGGTGTVNIVSHVDDIQRRSDGSSGWVGKTTARIGSEGVGVGQGIVLPFYIPDLQGEQITGAELVLTVVDGGLTYATGVANADVYGVRSGSASATVASDYTAGSLLVDNWFNISSSLPLGEKSTADNALSVWISGQVGTAGGSYVFITVRPDAVDGSFRYATINTADASTGVPVLRLTTGSVEPVTMNISASLEDTYSTGTGSLRIVTDQELRIGQGGTAGDINSLQKAILPFQLPALLPGETITAARLTFEVTGDTYANLSSNDKKMDVCLSGISTNPVVQSVYVTNNINVAAGVFDLNQSIVNGVYEVQLANLSVYLNTIYNGVDGQYVFLVLTPDGADARANSYVKIASANHPSAVKPVLTLEVSP